MKQFTYSRKEQLPLQEKGEEIQFKTLTDSFNLEKVIRSVEFSNGERLVVLDDFHEELRNVPGINPKTRQPTGLLVKERGTYQSEVLLSKEDGERFIKLLE